jgi:hypothetical protein
MEKHSSIAIFGLGKGGQGKKLIYEVIKTAAGSRLLDLLDGRITSHTPTKQFGYLRKSLTSMALRLVLRDCAAGTGTRFREL